MATDVNKLREKLIEDLEHEVIVLDDVKTIINKYRYDNYAWFDDKEAVHISYKLYLCALNNNRVTGGVIKTLILPIFRDMVSITNNDDDNLKNKADRLVSLIDALIEDANDTLELINEIGEITIDGADDDDVLINSIRSIELLK